MRRLDLLRASAACVLCVIASVVCAGVNEWTTKGPPGGYYRDFEASTTDANVFYAAYGHSLHVSVDGGLNWVARDFVGEVVEVSVDPQNGDRIFVSVLDEGLYRSTNRGQTFTKIAPGTNQIWASGVGPNNVVYYASVLEVRRSDDGGDTFGPGVPISQTFQQFYVNAQNPQHVYVIRGPFLMRTTNGGATWSESSIASDSNSIYSLVELPSGALVGATSGGIYTRDNESAPWVLRVGGLHWSVAADPLAPTTLIASGYGSAPLVRSIDGGITWTPIGSATVGRARRALISRAGSNVFITANEIGVHRSTNSGTTWIEAESGPISSTVYSLATTSAADAPIYAYIPDADGALFASTNDSSWERRGESLRAQQLGQAVIAVRPGEPSSLYLAAFQRGVFRSTDEGTTWTLPGTGLEQLAVNALAFDPENSNTLYASTWHSSDNTRPSLYRSTDNGATWSARSVDLSGIFALHLAVDPANGARMFMAGYQGFFGGDIGGLYRSINAGVNWTRVAFAGQNVVDVEIDPSNSNRIYVATDTGLHISTDGGTTFTANDSFAIITGGGASAIAIDPVHPSTLYAASSYDRPCCSPQPSSFILRSVDRGQSWEILRDQRSPTWVTSKMLLDPNTPSRVVVDTGYHGINSFEVVNDLSITMSGHSGTRVVGQDASFSLNAEHNGTWAATGVTLTTTLPSGLTNLKATTDRGACAVAAARITCTVPVLRPGEAINVDVEYRPSSAMLLAFETRLTAHEADEEISNNVAQASALAGEVVDLAVTLTPSSATVDRGDAVTYAVQVSNIGPLTSSATKLAFTLGDGWVLTSAPFSCASAGLEVTCDLGPLAVAQSVSLQFGATAESAGALIATATASHAPSAGDVNTANNSVVATITSRPISDLSIVVIDTVDPVIVGGTFDYRATVTNVGPDSAPQVSVTLTPSATVTGVVPSQGSCTNTVGTIQCALGEIASGASATVTISILTSTVGTVTMISSTSSHGADRVAGNNAAEQNTIVNAAPPIAGGGSGSGGVKGGGGGGGSMTWLTFALGILLLERRRVVSART